MGSSRDAPEKSLGKIDTFKLTNFEFQDYVEIAQAADGPRDSELLNEEAATERGL
jgi:hypothetical protein